MSSGLGFRDQVAIRAVLVVNFISRVTGRGSGTVLGGNFGLKISPNLLSALARGRSIILVSGTNGKTTTTLMAASGWGGPIATNATGANMPAGHVAALAADSSLRAVLEVDEAWLPVVLNATRAKVVILLNLSRDQLDRANEVRQMAERWRMALKSNTGTDLTVVANANDPLVVYAAQGATEVRWCDVPTTWLADASSCPVCTEAIRFDESGWSCSCGFKKPSSPTTRLEEHLTIDGLEVQLALSVPGGFNRSNAAMALSALAAVGVDPSEAVSRINVIDNVAGRFSLRHWRGFQVQLLLAKNPAGFSAVLSTVPRDDSDVWVAINARIADGKDPSWLYDVPFEQLRGHHVYCFGDRRLDLATRLDYANVEYEIVDDEAKLTPSGQPIMLLANYTAFSDWLERSTA
jgi:UDP-N-acetylmuramyl tripeptide synthase